MPDYADTLAALAKAREEARETLIELHGATKDARQMKQEVQSYIRETAGKLVVIACMKVLDEQRDQMQQMMVQSVDTVTRRITSKTDEVLGYINQKAENYAEIVKTVGETTDLMHSKAEQVETMMATVKWCHDQIHILHDAFKTVSELLDLHTERLNFHGEVILKLLPEEEESEDNGADRPPQSDGD